VELLAFLFVLYLLTAPGLTFIGVEGIVGSIERAVAAAGLTCTAFLVNGLVRVVLWDGLLSDHGQRKVPVIVTEGVGIGIYLTAILLIMHYIYNEPVGGLLATSGVAALALGFAAQSTLKEVFSGVALNATQALRIGDFVEIGGVYGQVYEINWRSVAIENPHTGSLYIFPNSGVAEQTILNFSEPTGRFKYFVHFTVEISAPPELVIRAIAEELEHSRFVRREPKPDFNMLGYTKEGIEIRIRYFFDGDDPWWDAQNEVIMAIWSAMRKHRLRIAINRHLLGSEDEWQELDDRRDREFDVQALLGQFRKSQTLSVCSQDSLSELAATANVLSLNPPGCFYQQGDLSDGLYFVLDGKVGLFEPVSGEIDNEVKVETCHSGGLFGLKSFLGRTSRNFVAQAEYYSVVAHLPEEAMRQLIRDHPALEAELASELQARSAQRKKDAEIAHKELIAALHSEERRRLSEELRQNVNELFARPAIHHFLSLLSSTVRHEDIQNATMAGAAIVAASWGDIDEDEKVYLRQAMAEADLLRHLDIETGLKLFVRLASDDDALCPKGRAFAMLDCAKEVKGGAQIVHAIAIGMTGVHGSPTEAECKAIAAISERLGVKVPEWAKEKKGEGHE